MSAVAGRLGVAPSALYNHVSGKEEILLLVEDEVMAQVETGSLRECLAGHVAAADALLAWAYSYRDVFSRHGPLIAHIATMPISGTRDTVEMYELVVQVLLTAGMKEERVMDAVVAMESFIFGSAYDVRAPEGIFDVPDGEPATDLQKPGLRRALARRKGTGNAEGLNPYADAPFGWGIRVLIGGLLDG